MVGLGLGCAGGGKATSASNAVYEGGGDDGSASAGDAGSDPSADATPADGDSAGPGGAPDLGSCTEDADCLAPPATCFADGTCEDGHCVAVPLPAGEPCDDGDACSDPDFCDGQGGCIGDLVSCTASHASGGTCTNGACQGLVCDPGFGNCDDDWADGCETALDSASDCGGCGVPCVAGPNASASCSGGTCQRSCTSPWANCDDDWDNGCEIPDGVPNTCDADGLNMSGGCWTAHCGQSAASTARNFGTWYCLECTTCHAPSAGVCQWCDHGSGNWYPTDACVCGGYEDLACG